MTQARYTYPARVHYSRTLLLLTAVFNLHLIGLCVPVLAGSIWLEGENATRDRFKEHSWYDDVQKDSLSENEWLSHYSKQSPGSATYRFRVSEGGPYVLWIRANPVHSGMEYQLDGSGWTSVPFSKARNVIHVNAGHPDHRAVGWVKFTRSHLSSGRHTLPFRTTGDGSRGHHGGIDCLLITDDLSTVPSGALKPSDIKEMGGGKSEWFPVPADPDPFSDRSRIDVSHLLHRPAGKHGFLSSEGEHLTFDRLNKPVQFWGCVANINPDHSRKQYETRARFLARHGVNMVRQHSVYQYLGPLRNGSFDEERLDNYDYWFSKLKEQGIYTTWSVFYHHRIPKDAYPDRLYAELDNGDTYGFVHLSKAIQNHRLRYVKKLLNHRNPYTGTKYRNEPALAVVEVQNEDSIFFHNPLNRLKKDGELPEHSEKFRRMWADWVKRRYENEDRLKSAWGSSASFREELPIYGAWQFAADRCRTPDRRKGDFIRFCTELQKNWYDRWHEEIRNAGFQGVTVTTAWKAGGPAADPANLFTDCSGDMISRHNYKGGGAGQHRIKPGEVNRFTHMDAPGSGLVSTGLYQVEDKPFSMTEWTQQPPNQWKLEAAPLMAFYQMGLQGMDASYHFTNSRYKLGAGWPGRSNYVTETPHFIGQFPALAIAIHRNHIEEAPIVAARRLRKKDLFTGVDPLGQDFSGGGWDDNALQGPLATPQETLAIGRVTVGFRGGRSARTKWKKCWNEDRSVVRSITGDLLWDSNRRLVEIRSRKTQGVVGFAGGKKVVLPDVKLSVDTQFVSLLFTSLDDRPLRRSSSILVTAMARDRQYGAEYSDDGMKLEKLGRPPLMMEPVRATITLNGPSPKTVRTLDIHGVPTDTTVPVEDGSFRVDGRYRSVYYLIER